MQSKVLRFPRPDKSPPRVSPAADVDLPDPAMVRYAPLRRVLDPWQVLEVRRAAIRRRRLAQMRWAHAMRAGPALRPLVVVVVLLPFIEIEMSDAAKLAVAVGGN